MRTLTLNDVDFRKLRNTLDKSGDLLRNLAGHAGDHRELALELADACDHWLEIVETIPED